MTNRFDSKSPDPTREGSHRLQLELPNLLQMSWRDLRGHVRGLNHLHIWIEDGMLVTSTANMRALVKEGLLLATHLSYFERADIASAWQLSNASFLSLLAGGPLQ